MDVIIFASYASRFAGIYRPVGICRLSGIYRPVDSFLPLWDNSVSSSAVVDGIRYAAAYFTFTFLPTPFDFKSFW